MLKLFASSDCLGGEHLVGFSLRRRLAWSCCRTPASNFCDARQHGRSYLARLAASSAAEKCCAPARGLWRETLDDIDGAETPKLATSSKSSKNHRNQLQR